MQYASLTCARPGDTGRVTRPIPGSVAAPLDRPDVTGWARLHADESATRLRNDDGRMLLTTDRSSIPSPAPRGWQGKTGKCQLI
jgi:hypothetical protein